MRRISILVTVLLLLHEFAISQTLDELNKPTILALDEVAPFSEGLAAVRKSDQWGFIDKAGKLVIDFRPDLVWNENTDSLLPGILGIRYPRFKEGRCLVKEMKEEDIPYYGFMDKTGKMVIEPEYLNITEFENGNALGIYCKRTFRGKNKIPKILEYSIKKKIATDGTKFYDIPSNSSDC